MTVLSLSLERLAAGKETRPWPTHALALAGLSVIILTTFHKDVADMVGIWWNASTFGHCLFIPPLIAWLVQQKLPELRRLQPSAWWPGLVLLAIGALSWLMGNAAGVALLRHAGLIIMLQGATVAMLGPAVSRILLFPIFYALFMVPFGEEIVPTLQLLTARLTVPLLSLVDIPAHLDGVFITTPTGYFEVAEACSGAKFLIAMTAYGALVCYLCFRSWRRRIAFLVGALLISLLANAVRAAVTIWVAHARTVDAAVGFDHVVYGWVFFATVMTVVMATAWPFFDRKAGEGWSTATTESGNKHSPLSLGAAIGLALALVAVVPLWASVVAGSAASSAQITLPPFRGWRPDKSDMAYPWQPRFIGADQLVHRRYANASGDVVDLVVALFDHQEEGKELVGFGQGAVDPDSEWVWTAPAPAPAGAVGARLTAPGPVARRAITFYIVGGRVTGNAGVVKWETLKARLLGGDQRAVAVILSAEERDGRPAVAAIDAFIGALGPVEDLADARGALR